MLGRPLRVGVSGHHATARGVVHQVEATEGMELTWHCQNGLETLEELLKNSPIDVFVEASSDLSLAAESALLAITYNAHLVLSDARVDQAIGLTLQAHAYENGLIVTSDAGTPPGSLATMIQEAHIMGFETLQAGQISSLNPSTQLLYEMAALANGFGFLPPEGGMTGPEICNLDEIISAFDLESYQGTPRVDFVRTANLRHGLYLIVKAKNDLNEEQINHLRACQLGDGPYFLLRRDSPLGYFETPKAILGAAAGQANLSPAYPSCEVYAQANGNSLEAALLPYSKDLVPHFLLPKETKHTGTPPTLENIPLPDSPLTQLWSEQRKIIENQASSYTK